MNSQYGLPYLPEKIATSVNDHIGQCKNLSLILDKYIPWNVIDNTSNKGSNKGTWLRDVTLGKPIDNNLAQAAYDRWLSMLEALKVEPFTVPLDWRMVVGLGGETVLETDITLHHLYGIPFIPGSALKGLTRAYVTAEYREFFVPIDAPEDQRKPSLKDETDHPDIQHIFGNQKAAGTVLFFDAMPLNGRTSFVVDIMNPHYSNYYNSLKSSVIISPANDQSPIPVPFLTVTDTTFAFALAPRDPNAPQHQEDVKQVKTWLQEALHHYGVGGKTSAGYGYFTIPQQQKATVAPPEPEAPRPYVRPNIPIFVAGQGIAGSVIGATDELHHMASEAKAFLRYREFPTKDVVIIVDAEEAANWTLGNTKNCLFVREEVREGCTMLICQPGATKKKKGKNT